MDFSVDILIPTYNRKKFEKLISHNISIQTYPLIKNVIIADDSNDNLHLDINYSVLTYKVERMSIGEKRKFLLSKSTSRYRKKYNIRTGRWKWRRWIKRSDK